MAKTQWKIVAVLLLSISVLNTSKMLAEDKTATDDVAFKARIDKRIEAWQPTKDERRFDDIGWAKDIRDAVRLAKENKRPIFLFSYSGSADREHAMALQRC